MKEELRIEQTGTGLLIILPFKMDNWATPYQEAGVFGNVLREAAADHRRAFPFLSSVIDPMKERQDINKIKFKTDERKKLIILLFEHTDRIEIIPSAAIIIGSRILMHVQDLTYLFEKGVRMRYDVKGRKGRVTPEWSLQRKWFGKV